MVEAYGPFVSELVEGILDQGQARYELYDYGDRHGTFVWTFARSAGENVERWDALRNAKQCRKGRRL